MISHLTKEQDPIALSPVSLMRELCAYEALWAEEDVSFKKLSEKLCINNHTLPSDFVSEEMIRIYKNKVCDLFKDTHQIGVQLYGIGNYPETLKDAKYPVRLLYYQGLWDLVYTPCIAVIGTRNPTNEGKFRTRKLVHQLVEDGFTIVSGLAKGIDTAAHEAAIEARGRTIAVIGTPLSEAYPKENSSLQCQIAENHLLISQVPFFRYQKESFQFNKHFFPERNKTMSALSLASIIVEASETSGTLIQARACLEQDRKLFILDNCFQNNSLTWPKKFEAKGAIRVKEYNNIREALTCSVDLFK